MGVLLLVLFCLHVVVAVIRSNQTSVPLPYDKWIGKKVMFIYPHIDDMEGSAGGLVALLNGQADIHLLIITNGDKGCGNDELCGNLTNSQLAALRQQEQLTSAAILSINPKQIYYLNYEDCQLQTYPKGEILQEITSYIRIVRPDVVFTWDPTPRYELIPSEGWDDIGYHPDHQYAGQLTIDSIWTAQLNRYAPELGEAWQVPEVYLWMYTPAVLPSHYLDITGEAYNKKLQAFLAMESQYSNDKVVKKLLHFLGTQISQTVGLPEGRFAEGYMYIMW